MWGGAIFLSHKIFLNMKYLSVIIFVLLCFLPSMSIADNGGKKPTDVFKRSAVVKTYRSCMKDKNYTKAKQTIDEALKKYDEAKADAQFYRYKMDALNELIGQENRKIYLNSKPDTVSYFGYIYELYATGILCDSVEQVAVVAKLNAGKKMTPKLRVGVGQTMLGYRKNLLSAGKYYYIKKDYGNAFRFFDMYLQTKASDVFSDTKGNSTLTDPDDQVEVSVLAVLSAYGSSNHRGVIDYLSEGLKDTKLESQILEIGSKSAAEVKDTVKMVSLLEQGFDNYPEIEYFFMTLMKHYNGLADYGTALQKASRMTELYPQKRDYWYMAGTEQALLFKDEEALQSFSKCIEIKADDADAYASIGNIYLRQAHAAYAQFNVPLSDPTYTKKKSAIDDLYKQACRSFEQARKFDENHPDLWLAGLRETYFKLNRGKALKALEKYQ